MCGDFPCHILERKMLVPGLEQRLTRGAGRRRPAWLRTRAEEQCFNLKLSGNEIDCTHVLLLLIKIMLCSNPHDQKVF